jgi:hypothetical protein
VGNLTFRVVEPPGVVNLVKWAFTAWKNCFCKRYSISPDAVTAVDHTGAASTTNLAWFALGV